MIQNRFAKSKALQNEAQRHFTLFKDALLLMANSPFIMNHKFDAVEDLMDNGFSIPIYGTDGSFACYSEDSQQSLYLIMSFQYKLKNHNPDFKTDEIYFSIAKPSLKVPTHSFVIDKIVFKNGDIICKNKPSNKPDFWENNFLSSKSHYQFHSKRFQDRIFFYDEHVLFLFSTIREAEKVKKTSKEYCPNDTFKSLRFMIFSKPNQNKPLGYKFYKGYLKEIFWCHPKIKQIPNNLEKPSIISINNKNKMERYNFRYYYNHNAAYYQKKLFDFYKENDIKPKKNFSLTKEEKLLLEMNNILNF